MKEILLCQVSYVLGTEKLHFMKYLYEPKYKTWI